MGKKNRIYITKKVKIPIKECVIINLISTVLASFLLGLVAGGVHIGEEYVFCAIISLAVTVIALFFVHIEIDIEKEVTYYDDKDNEYVLRR